MLEILKTRKEELLGDSPVLVPVHIAGHDVVNVCACADEEEDDEEEGLEVEERGLGTVSPLSSLDSLPAVLTMVDLCCLRSFSP